MQNLILGPCAFTIESVNPDSVGPDIAVSHFANRVSPSLARSIAAGGLNEFNRLIISASREVASFYRKSVVTAAPYTGIRYAVCMVWRARAYGTGSSPLSATVHSRVLFPRYENRTDSLHVSAA